jgi:DNA invertase Pin-like site-specific DNA recombinase
MTAEKYVAYYRVSTQRQGRSGLGLEAQREAVRALVDGSGGRLLEEITEVESGKAVIARSFAARSVVPK